MDLSSSLSITANALHHLAPAGQAVAAQVQAGVDPIHALIATLVGLALSQTAQAGIEHNLATKAWMPQGLKPYLPALVSAVLGFLAVKFGVSAPDATAGALSLTTFTHAVNSSPKFASVGEDPTPAQLTAKQAEKAAAKVTSGDPRV